MPFIPHTDHDVEVMLERIGVSDVNALFDEIPDSLRVPGLESIGPALTEAEISRLMQQRARADGEPLCFLGAGAYDHYVPAAVWDIATRGEFYSAYTPYQAEASQGTLQVIRSGAAEADSGHRAAKRLSTASSDHFLGVLEFILFLSVASLVSEPRFLVDSLTAMSFRTWRGLARCPPETGLRPKRSTRGHKAPSGSTAG